MNILVALILLMFTANNLPQGVHTIAVAGNAVYSDDMDNCYITTDNEISRYDATGKLAMTFSNKTYGNISHLDVTNALKPLIFYQDFGRILFLDRFLSAQGDAINLNELEIYQAVAACSSHNNGIWIYDQERQGLLRLDDALKISHESGNLSQLISDDISAQYIVENDNKVYVLDSSLGILVFDIYATYLKTIPLKNINRFMIQNGMLFYMQGGNLQSYNLATIESGSYPFPSVDFKDWSLSGNHLFLLAGDSLKIYPQKAFQTK